MVRPISGFPAAGKVTEKDEKNKTMKHTVLPTREKQNLEKYKGTKGKHTVSLVSFLRVQLFLFGGRPCCMFPCFPFVPRFRLLSPAPEIYRRNYVGAAPVIARRIHM